MINLNLALFIDDYTSFTVLQDKVSRALNEIISNTSNSDVLIQLNEYPRPPHSDPMFGLLSFVQVLSLVFCASNVVHMIVVEKENRLKVCNEQHYR